MVVSTFSSHFISQPLHFLEQRIVGSRNLLVVLLAILNPKSCRLINVTDVAVLEVEDLPVKASEERGT